jgi:exodeoxyribonuclease V gamma subunit
LLPPGELGTRPLKEIKSIVEQIAGATRAFGEHAPASLDVNVALPDGRRLAGTIAGVCGSTIRAISYSRVRPRERVRAWVRLLALSAARPGEAYEALVIGRARRDVRGAGVTVVRIAPLPPREVDEHLATIIDLHDRGMREPLPLASETSAAYAQAGERAAAAAWSSGYATYDKEDRQPEHVMAFGGEISFHELLAARPHPDEAWHPDEYTRFGQYARRLWDAILARERLEDR